MIVDKIREIYDELYYTADTEDKLRSLEVLINKVQGLGEDELEFDLRNEWMSTSHDLFVSPDERLAHFAWLLQYEQKNPTGYNTQTVMWYYKWVAGEFAENHHMPKERIELLFEDMTKRYTERQLGLGPVYSCQRDVYIAMGEKELAQKYYELKIHAEQSTMDDCHACLLNNNLNYLFFIGDYNEVFKQAQPLLDRQYGCSMVPKTTYQKVVRTHVALRNWDRVEALIKEGMSSIGEQYNFIESWSVFMSSFAMLGKFSEARDIMAKTIAQALDKKNHYFQLRYYLSLIQLMQALLHQNHEEIVLSPKVQAFLAEKGLSSQRIVDFHTFFLHQANSLANEFDKRNDNRHYHEWLDIAQADLAASPVMN